MYRKVLDKRSNPPIVKVGNNTQAAKRIQQNFEYHSEYAADSERKGNTGLIRMPVLSSWQCHELCLNYKILIKLSLDCHFRGVVSFYRKRSFKIRVDGASRQKHGGGCFCVLRPLIVRRRVVNGASEGEGTVKAVTLSNEELTREALLSKVEEIPGAGIGIRIAVLMLMLEGWTSTQISEVLGLSRCGTVKLIQKVNQEGLDAITDQLRPGRPSQLGEEVIKELHDVLSRSPVNYGLRRKHWDGHAVVEYLREFHNITIHVRHAQRMIKKLGYSATDVRSSSDASQAFQSGQQTHL